MIQQLLTIFTNRKFQENDYFETVFLQNIDEKTPLRSYTVFYLQAFHVYFRDRPGHQFCFDTHEKAEKHCQRLPFYAANSSNN